MIQFISLKGPVPYEQGSALQKKILQARIDGKVPDTILFLEHLPVVTRGSGLQKSAHPRTRHVPLIQSLPEGIAYCETERGGDLTYHGPGQLVIYPIVQLDGKGFGPDHDLDAYLRDFENILIEDLQDLGLSGAGRRKGATGVWVGDQKVASIGIAIKRWVTFHGMAINVTNDLRPFQMILPCGFNPEVMTRLSDLLPEHPIWSDRWRPWLEERLIRRFHEKSYSGKGLEPFSIQVTVSELEKLLDRLPSEQKENSPPFQLSRLRL